MSSLHKVNIINLFEIPISAGRFHTSAKSITMKLIYQSLLMHSVEFDSTKYTSIFLVVLTVLRNQAILFIILILSECPGACAEN